MRNSPRSVLTVLAASVLAVPLVGSGAASAVTVEVGSNTGGGANCTGLTYIQVGSPEGAYRVPVDGVVTAWRTRATSSTSSHRIALKIGRAVAGGYQLVASSDPVPLLTGQREVSSRVPVKAGDLLGWGANTYLGCAATGPAGFEYVTADDEATSGPLSAPSTGLQLNIAATVELDADQDGFGDTTQDQCPTSAVTQGACPAAPAPDRTSPETQLLTVSAARARSAAKKATVTATFSASEAATFECAVDSPVFAPCVSPYAVKLKAGKHVLAVRSVDVAGNVDRSAAVRSLSVKVATKARSKKR